MKLCDVPIQTVVRESIIPKNHWVAKSFVCYTNWQGERQIIHGFSFSESRNHAVLVSKAEVLERLFACYDFHKKESVVVKKWSNSSVVGNISVSEVLIGATPMNALAGKDASGLGWGKSILQARQHALLEMIERHFLSKVWYEKQPLISFCRKDTIADDIEIEYTTLDIKDPIPFVLATVSHEHGNFWLCGSAVRTSFRVAKAKAREEALMLLDSILHKDSVELNPNPDTAVRLLSLRDLKVSLERKQFYDSLKSSLCLDRKKIRKVSLEMMASKTFGSIADVHYVILRNEPDGYLVRVLCERAYLLKEVRKNKNLHVPMDPFC